MRKSTQKERGLNKETVVGVYDVHQDGEKREGAHTMWVVGRTKKTSRWGVITKLVMLVLDE